METAGRSVLKTISWRIVIFGTDFVIAYLFTGRLEIAGEFAILKLVIASLLYFLHERGWNLINWGKR